VERRADSAGSAGNRPEVELNYGILPDTQLHLVAPYSYSDPAGAASTRGYGDTELGLKLRVVHETDSLPQVGIFPLVELPTGNAERGLGAGHTQVYLPFWLQKSWGTWTSYGGYGWWRNPGVNQKNWSFLGWLVQRDVSEHLTVGAELFHNTASSSTSTAATGYTIGAIMNLTETHHLLVSAGRNFAGRQTNSFYLAYQLTTAAPALAAALAGHPSR